MLDQRPLQLFFLAVLLPSRLVACLDGEPHTRKGSVGFIRRLDYVARIPKEVREAMTIDELKKLIEALAEWKKGKQDKTTWAPASRADPGGAPTSSLETWQQVRAKPCPASSPEVPSPS